MEMESIQRPDVPVAEDAAYNDQQQEASTTSFFSLPAGVTLAVKAPSPVAASCGYSMEFRPPRPPRGGANVETDDSSGTVTGRSASQPRASIRTADPELSRPQGQQHEGQLRQHNNNNNTKRSISQPRSSQPHFLHGFNMQYSDIRSIPDPPSPPQSYRNRRRRSTPVFATSETGLTVSLSATATPVPRKPSLEDVTNQASAVMIDKTVLPSSSSSGNTHHNRRKRKTLSHIPSPLTLGVNHAPISGKEENNNVDVRPKTLRINLCMAEDDAADGERRVRGSLLKRRKKRQSMVLPTSLPLQEDVDAFIASSPPTQEPETGAERPASASLTSFMGDLAGMRELQSLVRSYCAKPDSERTAAQEVETIRQITGYPLSTTNPTNQNAYLNEDSRPNSQAGKAMLLMCNRRLVYEKLGPVMAQMERRKEEDKQKWEQGTGCRVAKSNRSGKYKYYSIETNVKVGSQEYKHWYMSILDQEKPIREAKALVWMDRLLPKASMSTSMARNTVFADVEGDDMAFKSCVEDFLPPSKDGGTEFVRNIISMNSQGIHELTGGPLSAPYDKNEILQREAFLPPRSDPMRSASTEGLEGKAGESSNNTLSALESSRSIPESMEPFTNKRLPIAATVSNSELDEPAEISEASSEDTADSQCDLRSSSPLAAEKVFAVEKAEAKTLLVMAPQMGHEDELMDVEWPQEENKVSMSSRKAEKQPVPLLPLPSRDEGSMDPEIALAEKRLWDRMDLALQEYSREVMEIKSRKTLG